jgi:hypothetical protein
VTAKEPPIVDRAECRRLAETKGKTTAELIAAIAKETGAAIALGRVEDMREIVGSAVMCTPAVVVDGQVVHVGSAPARAHVEEWLARDTVTPSKGLVCTLQARPASLRMGSAARACSGELTKGWRLRAVT